MTQPSRSGNTTVDVACVDWSMDIAELHRPASRKRIALVAHDKKKLDLLAWARFNRSILAQHDLVGTGTTGRLISSQLGLDVRCFQSGPLGGDQQLGAEVTIGRIDLVLFFWDPLEPQPHDPDVKALLRIAVVWNVPMACNRASADYVISSPLLSTAYERTVPTYDRDVWLGAATA